MDFEIITEDEFTKSRAAVRSVSPTTGGVRDGDTSVSVMPDGAAALEYCEFCKGFYIMEYHVSTSTSI